MGKNPIRHKPLTNWNRETFEQKNSELKKRIKDALNELGFDSAMNISDDLLVTAVFEILWSVARAYQLLKEDIKP